MNMGAGNTAATRNEYQESCKARKSLVKGVHVAWQGVGDESRFHAAMLFHPIASGGYSSAMSDRRAAGLMSPFFMKLCQHQSLRQSSVHVNSEERQLRM